MYQKRLNIRLCFATFLPLLTIIAESVRGNVHPDLVKQTPSLHARTVAFPFYDSTSGSLLSRDEAEFFGHIVSHPLGKKQVFQCPTGYPVSCNGTFFAALQETFV